MFNRPVVWMCPAVYHLRTAVSQSTPRPNGHPPSCTLPSFVGELRQSSFVFFFDIIKNVFCLFLIDNILPHKYRSVILQYSPRGYRRIRYDYRQLLYNKCDFLWPRVMPIIRYGPIPWPFSKIVTRRVNAEPLSFLLKAVNTLFESGKKTKRVLNEITHILHRRSTVVWFAGFVRFPADIPSRSSSTSIQDRNENYRTDTPPKRAVLFPRVRPSPERPGINTLRTFHQ